MIAVEEEIRALFARVGAAGFLHAREIRGDAGNEIAVGADEPVVLASVFKIPVAVAFERAVSAGVLRADERATVTARHRRGGIGTAGLHDDATLSLRDLAHLMLTLSDNAATDILYHRLGPAAVDAVAADLGLTKTRIVGCCEDILDAIADDLGVPRDVDIDEAAAAQTEDRLRALSVLDPLRTSASTPRDMTALIEAIWTDRAADPEACARVRDTMAHQVWPHRLTSGFTRGERVAAKTGTLPGIRNEVGAVTYPDGRTFAVAVFTRAASLAGNLPEVDRAIGDAARLAVEALRGIRS